MKQLTTRQIVAQLRKQGHKISFIERNDGGIRITKIDGQRFQGSEGNVQARKMTGVKLSERREKQLHKPSMVTPKGKWSHKRKSELSDEEKRQIQRLQRLWHRKQVREGYLQEGMPTRSNYRYIKEHYGLEEAQRRLMESERYALGYAYLENVNALISRLQLDMGKLPQNLREHFQEVIDKIEEKRFTFKDIWINKINEVTYDWEKVPVTKDTILKWKARVLAIMD